MMRTTTRISISVKPAPPASARPRARDRRAARLVAEVPVADVGVDPLAPGLAVGAERVKVVLLAVRAGVDILILVPPGILAHALEVAARLPVPDARVGRLLHERLEALLRGRVLRVVEIEYRQGRLERLDIPLGLGDLRVVHLAHDGGYDERGQQADDDDDHHDFDESEAARARAARTSFPLVSDVIHTLLVRAAMPPLPPKITLNHNK